MDCPVLLKRFLNLKIESKLFKVKTLKCSFIGVIVFLATSKCPYLNFSIRGFRKNLNMYIHDTFCLNYILDLNGDCAPFFYNNCSFAVIRKQFYLKFGV